MFPLALFWLAAYLVASIPFGLLVAKARGVDLRAVGSGNIGATNVGRVLGRKLGMLVLFLDALKGFLPMFASGRIGQVTPLPDWGPATESLVRFATGVVCIIGAIAPIYLRFRGGKGVAASLGIVLGVWESVIPALFSLLMWIIVKQATRLVSLASIVASLTLPSSLLAFILWRGRWGSEYPLFVMTALMATFVLYRHRANMVRLVAGTEPRAPHRSDKGAAAEAADSGSAA